MACVSIASIKRALAFGFRTYVFDEAMIAVAVVGRLIAAFEHLQIALTTIVALKFLNVEHALGLPTLGSALRHKGLLSGVQRARAASAGGRWRVEEV